MTDTAVARVTALITPVEQPAQDEALRLAAEGREVKAVARLRKGSGLGLLPATAALELLRAGTPLPASYDQAAANLRMHAPQVAAAVAEHLRAGDQTAAIKLLRQRTELDLAGGYHLAQVLVERPNAG